MLVFVVCAFALCLSLCKCWDVIVHGSIALTHPYITYLELALVVPLAVSFLVVTHNPLRQQKKTLAITFVGLMPSIASFALVYSGHADQIPPWLVLESFIPRP